MELQQRLIEARRVASGLHSGRVPKRMCIPPQADDTDIVLCGALDDALEEIKRMRSALTLIEHKADQALQGQYSHEQLLGVILQTARAALREVK